MSTHLGDNEDFFTPLPPKLPHESRSKYPEDDPIEYIVEEREPQLYRKVKLIRPEHVHDQGAHPRVEHLPPSHHKRDSGKYYVDPHREERPVSRRVEHERHCSDSEVRRVTADFSHLLAKETKKRVDAEDRVIRLENDLEHEKRKRSLEARERAVRERNRRLDHEAERIAETRRPVIVHNPPPAAAGREANRSALDRAQDDYRRRVHVERPFRDERRPVTSDGVRPRRQSVVIIDDPEDRRGGRPRH